MNETSVNKQRSSEQTPWRLSRRRPKARIHDARESGAWLDAELRALPRVETVAFTAWEAGLAIDRPRWSSTDTIFRRALVLADLGGAYLALLLVVLATPGTALALRPTALLIGLFVVLLSKVIGLYDRDQHTLRKTTIDEVPKILYLSICFALATWLAEQVLLRGWLGRPQVFGLVLGSFVFITVGRILARHSAIAICPPERCLLIGNVADATRTASKLSTASGVKAHVVGRVSLVADRNSHALGTPTLGDVNSLPEVVANHRIDRAIIAPDSDEEATLHAIRLLKALGIKVSVVPRLLEVVGSSSVFDEVDGITLLGVRPYGLSRSSAGLKRTMDTLLGAVVLTVLAPLFAIVAVAIKLDSRGPVFFLQPRIGRQGRRFQIVKFRSMVENAEQIKAELTPQNEAGIGLFKISDDPRITRVGRFLRRTSLDELPQLLNVLRGEMSLVGPRPLVPSEDALIEGWQRRRLALKPGMTGLWQIFGSSRIPMHEMVKIDYIYGANWSIWLDLKILLRTVPYMLRRRGR